MRKCMNTFTVIRQWVSSASSSLNITWSSEDWKKNCRNNLSPLKFYAHFQDKRRLTRQDLFIRPWRWCFAVTKHLLNIMESDGCGLAVLMPLPPRFGSEVQWPRTRWWSLCALWVLEDNKRLLISIICHCGADGNQGSTEGNLLHLIRNHEQFSCMTLENRISRAKSLKKWQWQYQIYVTDQTGYGSLGADAHGNFKFRQKLSHWK